MCVYILVNILPLSLQVDIGQGKKAPGHYIQRSSGLFPAPYPQNSPEMDRLCRLFDLLGVFIAKCIQDKRRVDLPLARPFFKLMSTSRPAMESYGPVEGTELDQSEPQQLKNNQEPAEDAKKEPSKQQVSNMHQQSHSQSPIPSSHHQNGMGVGATSAKEAELQLLVAGEEEEITKDGAEKEKEEVVLEELGEGLSEVPWHEGLLDTEDLKEVNPFR